MFGSNKPTTDLHEIIVITYFFIHRVAMESRDEWWVEIEENDKRFERKCHPSCVDCDNSCEYFWYLARHGTSTWCKKQQDTSEAAGAADEDKGDFCLDAILTSCG